MNKKTIFAAAVLPLLGIAVLTAKYNGGVRPPADLRDAVAESAIESLKTAGGEADINIPEPKAAAVNDPSTGAPAKPAEWVTISGGKFTMGTDSGEEGFEDANPAHEVTVKTFQMAKTAVTVAQYAECVSKGACTEPGTSSYCNWGKTGLGSHPVNCVNWDQAQQYAKFKGARLPSEAEFEYAATSGGKNQKYPWGNDEPTCDKAVMYGNGGYGCGKNSTMPVCSKTAGNTAQGLCDMAGNVWQWVQDKYQDSYKGVPADGSASEGAGSGRVLRGGSFYDYGAIYLRADYRRNGYVPGRRNVDFGFRLVRSSH